MPSARFVHDLNQDVRRAARQRLEQLGIQPAIPFEEMVIELRKLVRLLRRTLVPVSPGARYIQRTGRGLQQQAVVVAQSKQNQQRWLMVGGVLGSVLSVSGLLAALLLRKRNNNQQRKE
jgi:hypothetical protein